MDPGTGTHDRVLYAGSNSLQPSLTIRLLSPELFIPTTIDHHMHTLVDDYDLDLVVPGGMHTTQVSYYPGTLEVPAGACPGTVPGYVPGYGYLSANDLILYSNPTLYRMKKPHPLAGM